jgi:hypothetical protein
MSAVFIIIADTVLKIYLLTSEATRNPEKTRSNKWEVATQVAELTAGDIISVVILCVKAYCDQASPFELILDVMVVVVQWIRFF